MLSLAKKNVAAKNVTFRLEDCQKTSLPDEAFDSVFRGGLRLRVCGSARGERTVHRPQILDHSEAVEAHSALQRLRSTVSGPA
jgi:hypothetical protein